MAVLSTIHEVTQVDDLKAQSSHEISMGGGLCGVYKEVLQKESGRRLCCIYSCCTCMELFQ
jgi:hypothetical protein